MKSPVLTFLLVIFSFSSYSQSMEWFEVFNPSEFINPTYYHAPIASSPSIVWMAFPEVQSNILSLEDFGSIRVRSFDHQGNEVSSFLIEGKAHIRDMRELNSSLYLSISFTDSVKIGEAWVVEDFFTNGQVFAKRDLDGNWDFTQAPDLEVMASGISNSGTLLYATHNGFGGDVSLKELNIEGNLLQSRTLENMGYPRKIRANTGDDGFILLGGCAGQTELDGQAIVPPDFYNNYVLQFNQDFELTGHSIIADISCVSSDGWRDGNQTLWFGPTAISPDFGSLEYDGPNTMGLDFFLTKIADDSFLWVEEIPSDTGWYGIFPAEGKSIDVDSEGNTYVIGYQRGNDIHWENGIISVNQGTRDVWIASFDASGSLRWVRTFGGIENESGLAIEVIAQDEFYITANLSGPIVVDGINVEASYGSVWFAKFAPSALAISDLDDAPFEIYPNPVSSAFILDHTNYNEIEHIAIYSLSGREIEVFDEIIERGFDISTYSPGIYLVRLTDLKGTHVQKLIKY